MTDAPQPAFDMAALSRKFALWEASATALVPQNKASLFASLASANITRVTVIFDGEGDSGQIEDIQAFNGDVPAPLPEQQIDMLDLPYGESQAVTRQQGAAVAIETLAYDLLREKHEGWENSDGAYGEFIFDVVAGAITLDYNERFMSSENHVHEW